MGARRVGVGQHMPACSGISRMRLEASPLPLPLKKGTKDGDDKMREDLREGKKNLLFLRKDKEVLKRQSPRAAISHGKSRRARLHVPQCVRACGVCVCIVSTAVPVVDSLRAPRCQAVQPRREGRGGRLHARLGRRAASGARAWGGVSLRVGVVAVTMTAASSGVDWAAGSILRAGCISSSRPLCCYVSPMLPAAASQRCDQHRQCKTMPGQ